MASTRPQLGVLFLFLLFSAVVSRPSSRKHRPCKELAFYFHTTGGNNFENATSVNIAAPQATLPYDFGKLVVFDDPVTLDNNLSSPAVGRAQGMYLYDQISMYSSWFSFSFMLNSSDYVGTLNVAGQDTSNKTRDLSVIGGTGDFFMARGIATFSTDAYDKNNFRLHVDIKLYECW